MLRYVTSRRSALCSALLCAALCYAIPCYAMPCLLEPLRDVVIAQVDGPVLVREGVSFAMSPAPPDAHAPGRIVSHSVVSLCIRTVQYVGAVGFSFLLPLTVKNCAGFFFFPSYFWPESPSRGLRLSTCAV
jgi:hypothetical protein